MKLTVTSISTCIWEAILSGARWQSLPDGDASWFPGSCQSKNREGLWTWTLVTGQWLTVNLLRWIRLSPDNHQTRETFIPSDHNQLRSLLSFLFRKHPPPATRRVGARVLLSDVANVCNIPYNHTEMKPIELSSLLQTKFSSGQPRQTEKPFELSLSHVLLRGTSWYEGVAARNLRGVCGRRGVPATHVLLSRVSKWLQYNPTRRDEAPRTSFGLYKCFYIPGIYHNFGIMFWKNTQSYLEFFAFWVVNL